MRITLKQSKDASQCFRYFRLNETDQIVSESKNYKVAEMVIQKSYTRALESGYKPNWRTMVGWVDKIVFQDVDTNNTESWDIGKKKAEQILNFVRTWYDKILIPENLVAYSGLTLELSLGGTIVLGKIPIIKIEDRPIILSVNDVVQADWQLYNDLEVRGAAMLVADSLGCETVGYQRLTMGLRGGFSEQKIFIDSKGHQRTKEMISQIGRFISMGADYPSVTEKCQGCPFKRRCTI